MENKFKFKDKVKDEITGYKGTIVAMAEYVTGCIQYLVQPQAKDNDFNKGQWFDEPRIVLTARAAKPKPEKAPTLNRSEWGGPECDAPKK